MPARITIRDVARLADCGVATVSRVLNGSGPASETVREKVFAAAAELGFEFSEVGRSLQSRRSHTIAIVVPSLRNDVFASAIEGAQQAASEAGYQVLLSCVNYEPKVEAEALRTLVAKGIEGAVLTVTNPSDSRGLAYLEQHGIPYCMMFNQSDSARPSVSVDNVEAARVVAKQLMANGHEEIGFVALRFLSSERSRLRFDGFAEELRQNGHTAIHLLEAPPERERLDAEFTAFLDEHPRMSAIFASNDLLALSCIRLLRRLGRKVPDDISVVGFDGIDAGELMNPSLATIVTPSAEMGRLAAQRVLDAIAHGRDVTPDNQFLPFDFRAGSSLGPCRLQNADGRAATRPSVSLTP